MANLNTILAAAQEDDSLRVMLEQRLDTDARLHGLSASGPARQAIIEQIAHETYSAYTGGNPDRDTTLSERSAAEDFARGLGLGVREGPSNLIRRGVTGQGVPDFWIDEPDLGLSGKIGRELGTFLDPLTWVGFGVGGKFVSKGAQIVGRKMVQKGVQTAGRKAAMGLARNRAGQALAGALELAANPTAMRKSAAPLSRKLIASSLQGGGQLAGHAAVAEGAGQLAARDLDLGQLGKRVGTSALTGAAVLGPAVAVKNPIARYIAEAVAFPAVGGALEGHLPTEDDFIASFAVLGALKGFNAINDVRAKRALSKKKGERTGEEQAALDKLKSEEPEKIKTLRDEAIGGVVEEARSVAERMGIPQEQAMKSLRKALGPEREHLLDKHLAGEAAETAGKARAELETKNYDSFEKKVEEPFGGGSHLQREFARELSAAYRLGLEAEYVDDFISLSSGRGSKHEAKFAKAYNMPVSDYYHGFDPELLGRGRGDLPKMFDHPSDPMAVKLRTEMLDLVRGAAKEFDISRVIPPPRAKPTQQQMATLKGLAHRLGKDADGKVKEWYKRGETTATEVDEMIEILRADGGSRRPPPKGGKSEGDAELREFGETFSMKAGRQWPNTADVLDATLDRTAAFGRLQKRVRKQGGKVATEEDLVMEAAAYNGWRGAYEQWVRKEIEPIFVGTTKAEAEAIRKLAGAEFANSAPQHFSPQQLRDVYGRDPESVGRFIKENERLKPYAGQLREAWDNLLDQTIGRDSATYQRLKALGYDYVPLALDVETGSAKSSVQGDMISIFEPIFSKKGGGKAEFIDPLESMLKNGEALVRAAHKEKMANKLIDFVENHNLTDILEEVPAGEKTRFGEKVVRVRRPQEPLTLGLEGEGTQPLRDFKTYRIKPGKENARLWKALQSLDPEPLGGALKIMGIPARFLRAGAILNIEFGIRNPVRDLWVTSIQAKYGFNPYDYVRSFFSYLKKDEWYDKFEKHGGLQSALTAPDRVQLQKTVAEVTRGGKSAADIAKHVVFHPIDTLRMMTELSEYSTRIGVMRRSLEKGASMEEAIYESRRNPVDYMKGGKYLNSVNSIIPFFKAQVNGVLRLGESFKERPVQTMGRVATMVTLPSLALAYMNRQDPRWDDIPVWQKNAFWIVMTPEHVWRIPKPFDWGILFGSIPERTMEWMLDNDPTAGESIRQALGQLLPDVIPTAFGPPMEAATNWDLFRDSPIVPRAKQDLPKFMQSKSWTGPTARHLGKALGYSPAKLEHLWRGYTAGLGQYALDAADWTLERVAGSPTGERSASTPADIPGLRAFAVRYPSASGKQVSDFYDKSTEVDRLWKARKMLRFNAQQLAQVEAMHKVGADTRKQLIALRKQASTVEDSVTMSATEKRRRLDTLYKRMARISRMANKRLRMLDRLEIHSKRLAIRDSFQRF